MSDRREMLVSDEELTFALGRLATGFESADPHIRHEAKMVAKQNLGGMVRRIQEGRSA